LNDNHINDKVVSKDDPFSLTRAERRKPI